VHKRTPIAEENPPGQEKAKKNGDDGKKDVDHKLSYQEALYGNIAPKEVIEEFERFSSELT
jgi:hypothetical protein